MILFKKPIEICKTFVDFKSASFQEEWIIIEKTRIEKTFAENNLFLRLATNADIPELVNLITTNCNELTVKQLCSESDLFRTIQFGYFIVVENIDKQIVAFKSAEGYATKEKICVPIFVFVLKRYNGSNISALLSQYSSILAVQDGFTHKWTWIKASNAPSLTNYLNYLGYSAVRYERGLFLPNEDRLIIELPLNYESIFRSEIDITKLLAFLKTKNEGQDYILIKSSENDNIEKYTNQSSFLLTAYLPELPMDKNSYFVALNKKYLQTE